MKKSSAIQFFGSARALAEAIGVTTQAVYLWKDEVPPARQFQIELLTKGRLKAAKSKSGSRSAA